MSDKKAEKRKLEELEKRHKAAIQKRETLAAMITRIETEEHDIEVRLKEKRDELRRAQNPEMLNSTMRNKSDKAAGIVSSIKPYMFLVDDIPDIAIWHKKGAPAKEKKVSKKWSISGPADPNSIEYAPSDSIEDYIAARSVSTYPRMPGTDRRQGNPICDHYKAEIRGEKMFIAIGDGCGWGKKGMEASKHATEGFVTHLIESTAHSRDAKAIGVSLLESVAAAHNSVISGKDDVFTAGTTTLIGGVVFPLPGTVEGMSRRIRMPSAGGCTSPAMAPADGPLSNATPGAEFGVCIASIGDCKCFHWDVATKRVHDITAGSRSDATDASDPGGRLGPYLAGGLPDTRNLSLRYAACHTNDLLIFCSDGVHNNLDCEFLGVAPGDLAEELAGMSWEEAARANPSGTEQIRAAFYDARLDTLINEQYAKEGAGKATTESPGASSSAAEPMAPTPADVADFIVEYCLRTTFPSRQYLEAKITNELPENHKRYPGKMDHATVVVVRVDTLGV